MEHRDGTAFEDVVVIDKRTGKRILVNNTYEKEFKSAITKEEYETIINYEGDVVLIHNHAQGTRFSHTDIFTAFITPNVDCSIAVGHNGSVYMIYDFNRQIDVVKIYEEVYNISIVKDGNKDLARLRATDALYQSNAFKFVKE